jgi:hypothetical protein
VRDIGDFAIQRLEPVDIGKKYNLSRERLTCAFSRSTAPVCLCQILEKEASADGHDG